MENGTEDAKRDETNEEYRARMRRAYEERPYAHTEQMLHDLAVQWGRVTSTTHLETNVGNEELPTIYVPTKIEFDSLARLRVFASKAAMLFSSSEAEELAERRLSVIQDAADGGVISFGFDIDGGVHATVFEAGGDTLAIRNAEGIREALDGLYRGEGVYADNDKANSGVFLERQDMDILSRIHHAHANMLQALGALEWQDQAKLTYWTDQFQHFRNLYSRLHKSLGAGPETQREIDEAMGKTPEVPRANPLRLANAARMLHALIEAKHIATVTARNKDTRHAEAQALWSGFIDFLSQNLRSDDPEGGHIEIDFKTGTPDERAQKIIDSLDTPEHRAMMAKRSEEFIASLEMPKPDVALQHYGVNPWVPMTDPVDVKHMLKAQEELGECQSAVARCQMQGIDESEPVTGKVNRAWLMDEVADVFATLEMLQDRFGLDKAYIRNRAEHKKVKLAEWHAMAGGKPYTISTATGRWTGKEPQVSNTPKSGDALRPSVSADVPMTATLSFVEEHVLARIAAASIVSEDRTERVVRSRQALFQHLAQVLPQTPASTPKEGGSRYEVSLLRNLLALIHGDGGHYVHEHGIDKASEDAEEVVTVLRSQKQLLADTLGKVIMASGMLRKDIDGLTGPQLVQFGEELAESVGRMGRRNTPTHEHLSTLIGLMLSVKQGQLTKWSDNSPVARAIQSAVDHMKDWPYMPEEVGTVAIDSILEEAEAGLEVAVGRLAAQGKERGEFKTSEELALQIVRDARELLGGEDDARTYKISDTIKYHRHSMLLNSILWKMAADLGRTPDPATVLLDVNIRELTEAYFARWSKTRVTAATRFGVVMPTDVAADYAAMNVRVKRTPWTQSIAELNFKLNRQGNGGPTEREAIRLVNAVVDHLGLRDSE